MIRRVFFKTALYNISRLCVLVLCSCICLCISADVAHPLLIAGEATTPSFLEGKVRRELGAPPAPPPFYLYPLAPIPHRTLTPGK